MKTLLILRHAKSSWNYPELSDYDRPLNRRGKRDAPRMGEHLRQEGLIPDRILTSSAKRARKTASKVAKTSGYIGKVEKLDVFYDTVPGVYFETLQALPNKYQCVMVVGHNPTMEQLVGHLTGLIERMPTAALAHIELPIERWEELNLYTKGILISLWTPKTLFID
ncbi:MAG: histidine phosphatase family protein [Candidatus Poribacteria bacterium]|nr:histidine phosphatase family protein [Candidatus Poribacteria bacterium]MDE0324775.1 histidine phosphatase family protein [Candidatus Poribacteria bacterium]